MKTLKILIIVTSLNVLMSCSPSGTTLVGENQPDSFYVLVPKQCYELMGATLAENGFDRGENYFYYEFLGVGEAFSDILGFIKLFESPSIGRQQVLDMSSTLVSNCYPNGFYGIPRNGNEWSELAKEVKFLEENSINIYAIKIKKDMIQIHIDFIAYRKITGRSIDD